MIAPRRSQGFFDSVQCFSTRHQVRSRFTSPPSSSTAIPSQWSALFTVLSQPLNSFQSSCPSRRPSAAIMWTAVDRSSCQRLRQSGRATASSGARVLSFRCRRAISRASDRTCGGITPMKECGECRADLASDAACLFACARRRRRISASSDAGSDALPNPVPFEGRDTIIHFDCRRGDMPHFLSQAGHASVVLLEVIALLWGGRRALELVNRTRFRGQLMDKDNPAAGVLVAGFQIGLFLALSGLLAGEQSTLAHDAILTAAHGAGAIAALVLTPFLWRP